MLLQNMHTQGQNWWGSGKFMTFTGAPIFLKPHRLSIQITVIYFSHFYATFPSKELKHFTGFLKKSSQQKKTPAESAKGRSSPANFQQLPTSGSPTTAFSQMVFRSTLQIYFLYQYGSITLLWGLDSIMPDPSNLSYNDLYP